MIILQDMHKLKHNISWTLIYFFFHDWNCRKRHNLINLNI